MLSASLQMVGARMNAPPFSIAWQKLDLTRLPLARDDSTTKTSSTTSPLRSQSKAPDSGPHPGLSVGAAVGIGVGVGLGTIVLLVSLLWFLKRYKRNCVSSRQSHTMGGSNVLREIPLDSPTGTKGTLTDSNGQPWTKSDEIGGMRSELG